MRMEMGLLVKLESKMLLKKKRAHLSASLYIFLSIMTLKMEERTRIDDATKTSDSTKMTRNSPLLHLLAVTNFTLSPSITQD